MIGPRDHTVLFGILVLFAWAVCAQNTNFNIGVGIADLTGPAGDIIMMGYANIGQDTQGIHTRLYSRAYIFDQTNGKRVVFVSADVAFVTQNIKHKVSQMLKDRFGSIYTPQNVALSGTHTHSGPGGFADHILFQITSFGFVEENFNAICQGIFDSIVEAHNNIRPAKGFINTGDLVGANINRSPYSYEQNPEEERAAYAHDTDVLMTLLKIVSTDGREMGLIDWYAVHPVSMNNTNHLISSDHKGAASLFIETSKNGVDTPPGTGPFVAAFGSSNLGDVSPATRGAFCTGGRRPGLRCDYQTSTCPNWLGNPSSGLCHGQGPAGSDSKENTKIIADLQVDKTMELYNTATIPLAGTIDFRHTFVDMPELIVRVGDADVKLCAPAMGYSFAAGTTDGPGFFLFKQGSTSGNPYWDFVRDFIKEPSPELIACQSPKPIFFATGEMNFPHEWQAHIIDLQLLKIGNLVIIVVPGELTTMAGRRLRNAVKKVLVDGGAIPADSHVVISGLANTYADYFVTYEEYQVQRYEAASTIYGPHSLSGLIQEYSKLADAMAKNVTVPHGPTPPDFTGKQFSFVQDPKEDTVPDDAKFGGLVADVNPTYSIGQTAKASFWAGNPRNTNQVGKSFMYVEKNNGGTWTPIREDGNWDTEFAWEKQSGLLEPSRSIAHLSWFTDKNSVPGEYRLRYEGHSRDARNVLTPFTGLSSSFTLTAATHAHHEEVHKVSHALEEFPEEVHKEHPHK